mmetsp:Transcript_42731/g.91677  ORF Transcript_42731/g.91677 Transcript_42731/m.91677 type:complete len:211 (+) Transcript_42731:1118-1750(+)
MAPPVVTRSFTSSQCCLASGGSMKSSSVVMMRRPRKPDSMDKECAIERAKMLGSRLVSEKTPSTRAGSDNFDTEQANLRSSKCVFHMPSTAFVSSTGLTVLGGPGTRSFLLIEWSKHAKAFSGASGRASFSHEDRASEHLSMLSRAWATFLFSPLGLVDPSSVIASAYSRMKSKRFTNEFAMIELLCESFCCSSLTAAVTSSAVEFVTHC